MAVLSLSLLGSFAATFDGQSLAPFRSNKVQALLIYLVAENVFAPGTAARRDGLMELLWPGMPEASARQNLRQTLYLLRQAIPEAEGIGGQGAVPFLLSDRQTVQVNPKAGYGCDLADFQRLVAEGTAEALAKAAGLYRGDFLADFYLEDSNEFEAWAAGHRARLRSQVLEALASLATQYLGQRDFEQAEQAARRQLQLDELREVAHRQLMETLARSGQASAALAQYDRCRQLLEAELGMAPALETQRLAEAIRAGRLEQAAPRLRGYELQEQIGEGGFGTVYRALQPGVGREVAVRAIRRRYADDADFIRRFEREAQLVARLEHPYIVPLYDYWREPGGAYLVMRWMRGGSLQQRLETGAPWAVDEVVGLVEQVAAALAAAHRQQVVHRDIKPANILLDGEGNAYLGDFGIAKNLVAQSLTQSGVFVGSPYYTSPEQLLGEPVSPQSDLYSLGLIIYELLSGRRAYAGLALGHRLSLQLQEPLPSLRAQRPELPAAVDDVLRQATAVQPEQRYADALALATALREAVRGNGGRGRPAPATATSLDIANPYRGLRAFQEADARFFFGRAALTGQIVERLRRSRFLAVVGPSGSGKSSVVKAGLLPALRENAIAGFGGWFISEMAPGTHPVEELEAALLRVAVDPPDTLIAPLTESERGLVRVAKRILPQGEGELLLVIDQFEELFTLVADEAARRHFLQSLVAAADDPRSRIRVVITLRADFYDRPLTYQAFGALMQGHTQAVIPPTREELAEAIGRPAEAVGAAVAEALAAAMVADIYDQPGALPLLQYALTELFEGRTSNLLTLDNYEAMGGVSGAVGRRAEAIYAGLEAPGRKLARQLFLRLVNLGESDRDTRRRVPRSELEALTAAGEGEDGSGDRPVVVLERIVAAYGRARLLSFDRDPATREPTVEVAHEALLQAWPRLRGWLEESRGNVRQQRRLAALAQEWLDSGRDDGYLLRGSRLDQFGGWAANSDVALTRDEQAFLAESLAARQNRLAQEQARRREAERQARLASAREVAAAALVNLDRDPELSILLALESLRLVHTYEAENALHRAVIASPFVMALPAHGAGGLDVKYSPDGRWLAMMCSDGSIRLFDAATGRQQYATGADAESATTFTFARAIAFSPDGRLLATTTRGTAVKVWEAASGTELATLDVQAQTWAIAFSPDGRLLATANEDGRAQLLDVASGAIVHRLDSHSDEVMDVAFSPNGQLLATAGWDATAKLWNVASGEDVLTLMGHKSGIVGVRFNPDGSRLATRSGDGTAKVWDTEASLAAAAALSG